MRQSGRYVLYWAQMNRRVESNHALAYAVDMANDMNLPVLFYEGLTCSYPYANDRFHTFLLEGVPGTARRLQSARHRLRVSPAAPPERIPTTLSTGWPQMPRPW